MCGVFVCFGLRIEAGEWVLRCANILLDVCRYFASDAVYITVHNIPPWLPIMLHHVFAGWAFMTGVSSMGKVQWFGSLLLLTEGSTSFNNMHWHYEKIDKNSGWYNFFGKMYVVTWIIFRISLIPYLFWKVCNSCVVCCLLVCLFVNTSIHAKWIYSCMCRFTVTMMRLSMKHLWLYKWYCSWILSSYPRWTLFGLLLGPFTRLYSEPLPSNHQQPLQRWRKVSKENGYSVVSVKFLCSMHTTRARITVFFNSFIFLSMDFAIPELLSLHAKTFCWCIYHG